MTKRKQNNEEEMCKKRKIETLEFDSSYLPKEIWHIITNFLIHDGTIDKAVSAYSLFLDGTIDKAVSAYSLSLVNRLTYSVIGKSSYRLRPIIGYNINTIKFEKFDIEFIVFPCHNEINSSRRKKWRFTFF
jgi:hypothetical protein